MRVLGLSGSPRKGGNTELLIKRALDICKNEGCELDYVPLSDKKILDCEGCRICKTKECAKKDGVAQILDLMIKADALIIASPTYFSSVSGTLKSLFDRSLPLRTNGFRLSNKIGGAIACGGSRNGGQENTIKDIHNWMLLQEMIIVGDKKTAHFGGICVGRDPPDVLVDESGLKTVDNLTKRVIEVARRQKDK